MIKKDLPIDEKETLQEFLNTVKQVYGSRLCFQWMNQEKVMEKTYQEFADEVMELAKTFRAQGFTSCTVGLLGENSYEWIQMFFALILSDNVVVLIDKQAEVNEIADNLSRVHTDYIFHSKSYSKTAMDTAQKNQIGAQALQQNVTQYDIIVPEEASREDRARLVQTDIILFTSGTSGKSKAVMLSQKNILSDIFAICKILSFHGSSIVVLPLYHVYGLVSCLFSALIYGQMMYLNQSIRQLPEEFKRIQPYNICVVPQYIEYFYQYFHEVVKRTNNVKKLERRIKMSSCLMHIGIDLREALFREMIAAAFGSNFKVIASGGAPIQEEYVKFFYAIGIELVDGYGVSECSSAVTIVELKGKSEGCIGTPISACEIKIKDPDATGCGEICVRGRNVMLGYYEEKHNKDAFAQGWFCTGDLGVIKNGKLYLKGRLKNLIILSNGENVSAEELESKIRAIPYVIECRVLESEGKIKCQVYLDQTYQENVNETIHADIQKINSTLPKFKNIKVIEVLDKELKKTSTGKIRRN